MDSLRWHRVESLFAEAMERPPAAREAFVRSAAGSDDALVREVMSLVETADTDPDFLATPLVDLAAATAAAPDLPATNTRIDGYRLVRRLGRGGMGEVHLAMKEGDGFERAVALKVIRAGLDSPEAVARFRQERRILARLRHPNIASLLDGGATEGGAPYVVMEFVDGEPIDRYCDRRDLGVEERLALFLDVCHAVQHAHRNLVLHRDLKPANIFVTEEGVPKLLDFGIAKLLDDTGDETTESADEAPRTRTAMRLLTPEYAAPERIRGLAAATASDVFALGVVLYEVLTGVHPWAGTPPDERLATIERGPPTRPSVAAAAKAREADPSEGGRSRGSRRLTRDLDTILLKALRAEPDRRYPTIDALADDLRRYLDGRPVSARPDTFGYRSSRFVQRNKAAVTAAAVVLFTLVGASTVVVVQRSRTAARVAAERDKLLETRDFLIEMFGAVGPDEAGGGDVTARALLDAQAARVDDHADRPALQAEIQYVLADGYQRLGLVDQARPLARAALETRLTALRSDDPEIARAQGLAGWIEREAGDFDAAEELLRAAVATARASRDPGAAGLAKSLNDLGVVLGDLGRQDESIDALEESFDLREAAAGASGRGGLAVGITANNIGNAHYVLGRPEEAVRWMERSVAALESALGPRHGRVWTARANLLAFRSELLPGEDRIAAWRKHRAEVETVFGREHRETARAMQYLAGYLLQSLPGPDGAVARVEEARAEFTAALDAADATFGPDHPRTADILVGRSHAAMLLRDYRPAIADRERAVEIFRVAYGVNSPDVGRALREIARAWYGLGEAETGDRVAGEALAVLREAYGPGHPLTLTQQVEVARRRIAVGDAAGALPILRDASEMAADLDPANPPLAAQVRIALAEALSVTGASEEASTLLESVRSSLDGLPDSLRQYFDQVEAGLREGAS